MIREPADRPAADEFELEESVERLWNPRLLGRALLALLLNGPRTVEEVSQRTALLIRRRADRSVIWRLDGIEYAAELDEARASLQEDLANLSPSEFERKFLWSEGRR